MRYFCRWQNHCSKLKLLTQSSPSIINTLSTTYLFTKKVTFAITPSLCPLLPTFRPLQMQTSKFWQDARNLPTLIDNFTLCWHVVIGDRQGLSKNRTIPDPCVTFFHILTLTISLYNPHYAFVKCRHGVQIMIFFFNFQKSQFHFHIWIQLKNACNWVQTSQVLT